jgi:hypothetical protein
MFEDLTVVTPTIHGQHPHFRVFVESMSWLFKSAKVIVVDSDDGELIKPFCYEYLKIKVPLWEARKIGILKVKTKLTLNLDDTVVITSNYVSEALKLLEMAEVYAVAIDYERLIGHYGFGTSIWKTEILKQIYDWTPEKHLCECTYMWAKLLRCGGRLETLPFRAKHLKP